jgi:hypothetical protein
MACRGARYVSVEGLPTCVEEIPHNTLVSCQLEFGLRLRNMQGKGLSNEPCGWGRLCLGKWSYCYIQAPIRLFLFTNSTALHYSQFTSLSFLPYFENAKHKAVAVRYGVI